MRVLFVGGGPFSGDYRHVATRSGVLPRYVNCTNPTKPFAIPLTDPVEIKPLQIYTYELAYICNGGLGIADQPRYIFKG